MTSSIRVAVVGLGKMGISHFALVNAHPETETVICDSSGFMLDVLGRYLNTPMYRRYEDMLAQERLDAVVIATPSRLHPEMVRAALDKGIHVFCEKPFCLDWQEAEALADLAEARGLVGQVGYHNRYVGAFRRMKAVVDSGALGRVTHVLAEAYGPVVLRPKRQGWRSQKAEGGGCLYDYAAHPLNQLNWAFGLPEQVSGSRLESIFSAESDDQVFSTLRFADGPTAQLSVNWSDESHRKMTTRVSMIGTNGRLFADRQECQVYLRSLPEGLPAELSGLRQGWSVQYTTELTADPWFYLRGEEYSHQIDDFVAAIRAGESAARENGFRSAAQTDRTIAMILNDHEHAPDAAPERAAAAPKRRGWFGRG